MASRKICLAELVEETVASKGKRVISIPDLIYRVRARFPSCEHTDEELAELIAAIAIRKGCDLSFALPDGFQVDVKASVSG